MWLSLLVKAFSQKNSFIPTFGWEEVAGKDEWILWYYTCSVNNHPSNYTSFKPYTGLKLFFCLGEHWDLHLTWAATLPCKLVTDFLNSVPWIIWSFVILYIVLCGLWKFCISRISCFLFCQIDPWVLLSDTFLGVLGWLPMSQLVSVSNYVVCMHLVEFLRTNLPGSPVLFRRTFNVMDDALRKTWCFYFKYVLLQNCASLWFS